MGTTKKEKIYMALMLSLLFNNVQATPELFKCFTESIESCLLGSWYYKLEYISDHSVQVAEKLDNGTIVLNVSWSPGQGTKEIIYDQLDGISREKNKLCISENLAKYDEINSFIKRPLEVEKKTNRHSIQLGRKISDSLLSSESTYPLGSLLSQKQSNMARQHEWCAASPAECYRHVAIGNIIDTLIAAEIVRQNENKDEVGLKVMNSITLSFLSLRYKNYRVIEERPGYLYIKPEVAQGGVLPYHDFWEDIEIKIFSSVSDGLLDIVLVIDGRFAAGLRPPAAKSDYVDFEIGFGKEIDQYTKSLASSLNGFIIRVNNYRGGSGFQLERLRELMNKLQEGENNIDLGDEN